MLSNVVKSRARQNVILELGYFLGLLKRKNIVALISDEVIEIPSDYMGILYISMQSYDWKFKLVKELKEAGLYIDMDKL